MKKFVEYSRTQNAFHIREIEDAIKTNLKSIVDQQLMDWVPVGIFENDEQAYEFIETLIQKCPHLSNKA